MLLVKHTGAPLKRRKIIPYNPKLKEYARKLRNDSTFSEILLWDYLKASSDNQLLSTNFCCASRRARTVSLTLSLPDLAIETAS